MDFGFSGTKAVTHISLRCSLHPFIAATLRFQISENEYQVFARLTTSYTEGHWIGHVFAFEKVRVNVKTSNLTAGDRIEVACQIE